MSISDNIKRLKRRYTNSKSQKESIGKDFIAPCLRECKLYRRGTGFFNLSVFRTYLLSLDEIINNDVKMEIICSPKIKMSLYKAIHSASQESDREKIIQDFIEDFISDASGIKTANNPEYHQRLCCYLLSKGILEMKFAIPVNNADLENLIDEEEELPSSNLSQRNMYHIKHGYFEFPGGAKIAFEGSANESASAHIYNTEGFTIFKSWVQRDIDDVNEVAKKVDRDWGTDIDNRNQDIRVYSIGPEILKILKKEASADRPTRPKSRDSEHSSTQNESNIKYRHQAEAVEIFLQKKNGILNMATGTGKTRTALKIVNELTNKGLIDQFIITCDGKHLLTQWIELLEKCPDDESSKIFDCYPIIHTHKKGRKSFSLDPSKSALLVSINDVHNLENMDKDVLDRTLIIYDEVHDVGTINRIDRLKVLNSKISYKCGLSATPDKGEHNQEMTEAIENSVGKIIFEFDLKDAIERGILCEFEYTDLDYYLNDDDKAKMVNIQKTKHGREKNGIPMSQEEFAREISNVYKSSETKLESFEKYLSSNSALLKSTIIFVYDKEYGEKVARIVSEYTHNYSQFYGEDPRAILDDFRHDKIDVLVTCKAISQGIDIPNLRNVVLFSSDKQLGKTIQRLGRCLRNPPGDKKKVAQVVDFSHVPEDESKSSYDEVRVKWFAELSETKLKD